MGLGYARSTSTTPEVAQRAGAGRAIHAGIPGRWHRSAGRVL